MKKFVSFEGYNAMDYYGHEMALENSRDDAEFEVVLHDGDKLVKTDEGLMLVRDGLYYRQSTKMNTFKGVTFANFEDFDEVDTVQLKLIKL